MSKIIISAFVLVAFANSICADAAPSGQDDCPTICTLVHSPVCGTNGTDFQEFSSPCVMSSRNCVFKRENKKPFTKTDDAWCSSTLVTNLREKLGDLDFTKKECLKPCPLIYAPVCVTNGQYRSTVANACEMEFFNCVIGSDNSMRFRVLQPGAC